MIGIDTNVLVRLLVRDDEAQAVAAERFAAELTPQRPGFVTQVVMVEMYWVLSRAYGLPVGECLAHIRALVASEDLEFDDGEGLVRALTLAEAGADFADALIQGANELFGVAETVTFDRRAGRRLGWRVLRSP